MDETLTGRQIKAQGEARNAEFRKASLAQLAWLINAKYVSTMTGMVAHNAYRVPPSVPKGWSDWYANADELH